MKAINLKQGLMLTAVGILVLMLITVLVRMGTQRVLVERAKIDNDLTQAILTGTTYGLIPEDRRPKDKDMKWQKQYPFADIETAPKEGTQSKTETQAQAAKAKNTSWLMDKAKKIAAWPLGKVKRLASLSKNKAKEANRIFQREKSLIAKWSGSNLLGHNAWVEVGRSYEEDVDWHLMNPERQVVELEPGVWSTVNYKSSADNINERVQSVHEFSQWLRQKDIDFFYLVTPFKVDKYGDFEVNGKLDFSNLNADIFLAGLNAQGVDTIDLREHLHAWCKAEGLNYHDFFYRTDHHWKPETALRAAKVVGDKLKTYAIPVDDSHYNIESFEAEVLPEFFLGSAGKKVTLAKTQADDFSILHPRFPTQIHFMIPQREIDITGPLDKVAYERFRVARKDFYRLTPYGMYGYGDMQILKMENLLLPETDKKVLIVKDSYCDTMGPLLATGVRNIIMVDIRHFTGSLRAYIEECKPSAVIVMYHAGTFPPSPINWKSHKDKFDFR